MAQIIKWIIQMRFNKKWTQAMLANLAGIALETLIEIEKGNKVPSYAEIQRIIRAFQQIPSSLMDVLRYYPKHLDSFSVEIVFEGDREAYEHLDESKCLSFEEYKKWLHIHIKDCKDCRRLFELSSESIEDYFGYEEEDNDHHINDFVKNMVGKINEK